MVRNTKEYQREYMKSYSRSKDISHCDLCNSDFQRYRINRHNASKRHINLLKQGSDILYSIAENVLNDIDDKNELIDIDVHIDQSKKLLINKF